MLSRGLYKGRSTTRVEVPIKPTRLYEIRKVRFFVTALDLFTEGNAGTLSVWHRWLSYSLYLFIGVGMSSKSWLPVSGCNVSFKS